MAERAGQGRNRRRGVSEDVAEGLLHLGLTSYEIKVYQAILHHPRSRVPEIARYSGVPQPKVYATVKRLIERGLCESHLGPINQYSALDPADAFEPLMEETARRQAGASEAIARLRRVHAQATQGLSRREGRLKMFQGKPASSRNFKFLVAHSENTIDVVARLPMVATDDDETLHERLDAGVRVRMLCEIPDDISDVDRASLEKSKRNGAKVRVLKHVPMRMAVFDTRITILPMLDPAAGQGDGFVMLEIRNEGLSASFLEIYEMMWKQGNPF